ncbi:MAG: hypothetical protein HOH65_07925 [Rhodospirillaceae bacterium]|jgi:signal transduction histidine kinase|nr:hypothetical protein [Rhodospirillaceae bacterium]
MPLPMPLPGGSIRHRLYLAPITAAILLACLVAAFIYIYQSDTEFRQRISQAHLEETHRLNQLFAKLTEAHSRAADQILANAGNDQALADEIDGLNQDLATLLKATSEALDGEQFRAATLTASTITELDRHKASIRQGLAASGDDRKTARVHLAAASSRFTGASAKLGALIEVLGRHSNEVIETGLTDSRWVHTAVWIALFAVILSMLLISNTIARSIAGRLDLIVQRLASLASTADRRKGERSFDAKVDGDEIGQTQAAVELFAVTLERLRETQDELETRNRRLALEVEEHKKTEAEMHIARRLAESASTAKSDFLASMSHELRTPLNAISGFAQLLAAERDKLDEDLHECVDTILSSSDRLGAMIDQVLDLSHIETTAENLAPESVDPGAVLGDTLDRVRAQAAERKITINNLLAHHKTPNIHIDHALFSQVSLNLLSNAVKFNRDGGNVEIRSAEAPEGFVRLEVADSGVGVPDDQTNRLFHAFERLGQEAGRIQGAGIGLAIARELVEHSGGRIGYLPNEPEGSIFWLELPLEPDTDV